jgi:hypothetical protein
MLASTERLQKTTERLQLGKQQLAETEDLGVSILGDLARQRETIVNARDTLHGADDNISKARRVLSTMSKRVLANKIIMFGIRWGAGACAWRAWIRHLPGCCHLPVGCLRTSFVNPARNCASLFPRNNQRLPAAGDHPGDILQSAPGLSCCAVHAATAGPWCTAP